MADIFVTNKDANGLWAVSDDFKTELTKLQGSHPIWKAFFINSSEEIKGIISVGTIRQEVERELYTYRAQSCSLEVANNKGQWNEKGFSKNIIGESLTSCYLTPPRKDICGLDKGEYELRVEQSDTVSSFWENQISLTNRNIERVYTTKRGTEMFCFENNKGSLGGNKMYLYKKGTGWSDITFGLTLGNWRNIFCMETTILSSGIVSEIVYIYYEAPISRYIILYNLTDNSVSIKGTNLSGLSGRAVGLYKNEMIMYAKNAFVSPPEWGIYTIGDPMKLTDTPTDVGKIKKLVSLSPPSSEGDDFGGFMEILDGVIWIGTSDKVYKYGPFGNKTEADWDLTPVNFKQTSCIGLSDVWFRYGAKIYKLNDKTGMTFIGSIGSTNGSIRSYKNFIFHNRINANINRIYKWDYITETWIDTETYYSFGEFAIKEFCFFDGTLWIFLKDISNGRTEKYLLKYVELWKNNTKVGCFEVIFDDTSKNLSIINGLTLIFSQKAQYLDRAFVNIGYFANRNIYEENVRIWKGFKVLYSGNLDLGEAVDNTNFAWETGGSANWFNQTAVFFYGEDAAQSGDITDQQSTFIKAKVMGPGNLSFYWKVSSEVDYDFLSFYIDDVLQNKISGQVDWQQRVYSITSGEHTLKWTYSKDESFSYYSDCGWLDKVEFTGSNYYPLCEYIPAFTGMIDTVQIRDIGGIATINLIDYNKKLSQVTAERVTMDGSDGTLTTKLNVSDTIDGGGKGLLKTAIKIPVLSPIDKFPTSGKIKIENEIISYASKIETTNDTSFNGCIRGVDLTSPSAHRDAGQVENYQWYVASRMDKAIESLLTKADITDYQIDETIIQADFKHFSYHGKTPNMPPFGVIRCMCYDKVRNNFWIGIDDKLYIWKNGIWTLKGTPEAGSYIYQIAVWDEGVGNNGNVFFVTCSLKDIVIARWRNPTVYNGAFKLWKYNILTSIFSAYTTLEKPFYATLIAYMGGHDLSGSPDIWAKWRVDNRKGFFIASNRLFFTFFTSFNEAYYTNVGIAYINLTNDLLSIVIQDLYFVGAFCMTLSPDKSYIYFLTCYTNTTAIRKISASIPTNITLLGTYPGATISIPEMIWFNEGGINKIAYVFLWYNVYPNIPNGENQWKLYICDENAPYGVNSVVYLYTKSPSGGDLAYIDDCPRGLTIGSAWNEFYFILGTDFSNGTALKLYKIDIFGERYDIGIPIMNEKGSSCNLLYVPANESIPEKFLGISYPSYILWQYSTQSIISAFNQGDFRANYGINPIKNIIEDFALCANFLAFFDELGKFYFVKKSTTGTILIGFSEKDITNINYEDGNIAGYPIINKAIVETFDGKNKIYELDSAHPSKVKYGLETYTVSNSWMNNEGVAYGIAKELVEKYNLPKAILKVELRWYPLLILTRTITIAKPSMGIEIYPKIINTTINPTITEGNKWQVLKITEDDTPKTAIEIREI